MPPPLYTLGSLHLTSFKLYRRRPSGTWTLTHELIRANDYRWRFMVKNLGPNPHDDFQLRLDAHPQLSYFTDAGYSQRPEKVYRGRLLFHPENRGELESGRQRPIYAYFKWSGLHATRVTDIRPRPRINMVTNEIVRYGGSLAWLVPNLQ